MKWFIRQWVHGYKGQAAMLTAMVIILSGCSQTATSGRPTPTGATKCGQPSGLVSYAGHQAWLGAVAGPLFFSAFSPGQTTAVLKDFASGYPYKVLVQPMQPLSKTVKLMGWNCSTNKPLRFWYRDGLPFAHVPAGPAEFAVAGDLVATFSPSSGDSSGQPSGYTGYMLFTQPGQWKVSVEESGTMIGSAVFLVKASS